LVGGVIRTDNRIKHITKVYQITENETIASLAKHPNIDNLTGGVIHQKRILQQTISKQRKEKQIKELIVIIPSVKRLSRAESQAFCLE